LELCHFAKTSKSGYYEWLRHSEEPEKDHDDYLTVKRIFDKGKAKRGARTIKMKLQEENVCMNLKKISRIMKKYHLTTKIRRKNPYKMIMKKSLEHRTAPNILRREFGQMTPYAVLSTDITYLWWNYRFAYLSVVKDLATGEVVAWHLSMHLEMDLVMNTLSDLKRGDGVAGFEQTMIHSDQGFHYTNPLYIRKLADMHMVQSMSRKGNCIDNSPIESFFGHMKDEVDCGRCKTFEELRLIIDEYMRYYNYERPQWERKKMTPVNYRNHLLESGR
jgi:transposase InsO family protein